MIKPLSLDEILVCILSNIAGFMDQRDFVRFVCLSRANSDAHLLPRNITFKSVVKLTAFRKWHNLHRNRASDLPRVHLKLVNFSDRDFSTCSCINIHKLEVQFRSENVFTGRGLGHLVHTPLTDLSVYFVPKMIDSSLIHIGNLPLTSLTLVGARDITGDGFKYLSEVRLTSLSLSRCVGFMDTGIAHLAKMPLTKLDISSHITFTYHAMSANGPKFGRGTIHGCWNCKFGPCATHRIELELLRQSH